MVDTKLKVKFLIYPDENHQWGGEPEYRQRNRGEIAALACVSTANGTKIRLRRTRPASTASGTKINSAFIMNAIEKKL